MGRRAAPGKSPPPRSGGRPNRGPARQPGAAVRLREGRRARPMARHAGARTAGSAMSARPAPLAGKALDTQHPCGFAPHLHILSTGLSTKSVHKSGRPTHRPGLMPDKPPRQRFHEGAAPWKGNPLDTQHPCGSAPIQHSLSTDLYTFSVDNRSEGCAGHGGAIRWRIGGRSARRGGYSPAGRCRPLVRPPRTSRRGPDGIRTGSGARSTGRQRCGRAPWPRPSPDRHARDLRQRKRHAEGDLTPAPPTCGGAFDHRLRDGQLRWSGRAKRGGRTGAARRLATLLHDLSTAFQESCAQNGRRRFHRRQRRNAPAPKW